jgi:hypothetical protein
MTDEAHKQVWLKTGTHYFFRLQESGIYYGRIKRDQKNFRTSMGTSDYQVAIARRELTKWMAGFETPEKTQLQSLYVSTRARIGYGKSH